MRKFHVYCSAFALVALGLVAVADAQPGGRGGFGGLSQILSIEGVGEELEITEDQTKQVKEVADEIANETREAMEEARGDFDFREASEEERAEFMKKFQDIGAKMLKKEREKLKDVLLDHQVERLEQLRVQQLGSRAMSDASVIEKLKITEKQKEELKKLSEGMQTKMSELFSSGDRENMREKMTEMREEAEKEVMAILTDKQIATLKELKGGEFKFPERQQRGGRGEGGRGGDNGEDRGDRRRPESDDTN